MPTSRGRQEVRRFIAQLPAQLAEKVARGAARAAGRVIADEAKAECNSSEVAAKIVLRTRKEDDKIRVLVTVKGSWERSVAGWIEFGTAPHFISVDDAVREGRTAGRINRLDKEAAGTDQAGPGASLWINGKPAGTTVFHPGVSPKPFLRTALDRKEGAAIAAAQQYISARVTRAGIISAPEGSEP